jgi:ubiquinone biosynthesis protein UbiJ
MIINQSILKLINLILVTNDGSRKLLALKHGRTFKIILPGFSICAACDIDGYLITEHATNYDVVIHIPLDSATFLINRDKLAVYKKITFVGDAEFGRELLEILAKLHINGVYTKIDSPLMLMLVNKLSAFVKSINNYLQSTARNSSNTLKEYLMYETQDIITRLEHDQFCNDVDELKAQSEILEKRIKQLSNKAKVI